MKKASGFYADSMEMLLDTMCNVLGAIIFITLTLAVLARSSPAPTPEDTQRQAAELTNALDAVTISNAWLQAELQQTLQRLQEPNQRMQTNLMRLPITSQTAKKPWDVILRYGRVYPLHSLFPGARNDQAQNIRTVEWQRVRGEGIFVKPKLGQGDDPGNSVAEMVQSFKRSSKTNFYFAFWVYEDSFAAFNRAKETAASLGFQYGWEPLAQNARLKMGERGESIPPQN